MPYVERWSGTIVATYSMSQPGRAEEFLPPENPEVAAFEAAMKARADLEMRGGAR